MSAKAARAFKQRVEATFRDIDKKGTGHVSYITFLSWCKKKAADGGGLSEETLNASRTAFVEHDKNSNGTIEVDELASLLDALDLAELIVEEPVRTPRRKTAIDAKACQHCGKDNKPLEEAELKLSEAEDQLADTQDKKEDLQADLTDTREELANAKAVADKTLKKALSDAETNLGTVIEASDKECDELRKKHATELRGRDEVKTQLMDELEGLEAKLAEVQGALESVSKARSDSDEKNKAVVTDYQQKLAELKAADAQHMTDAGGQEARLQAQLTQCQKDLDECSKGHVAHAAEAEALKAENEAAANALKKKLSECQAQLADCRKGHEAHAVEMQVLRTENKAAQDGLNSEAERLKKMLADSKSAAAAGNTEAVDLQQQLSEMSASNRAAEQAHASELTALRKQLADMEAKQQEVLQTANLVATEKNELEDYVNELEKTSEDAVNELHADLSKARTSLMLGKWKVTSSGMKHTKEKEALEAQAAQAATQGKSSVNAVQSQLEDAKKQAADALAEKIELEHYADELEQTAEASVAAMDEEHQKAVAQFTQENEAKAAQLKLEHQAALQGLQAQNEELQAQLADAQKETAAAKAEKDELETFADEIEKESDAQIKKIKHEDSMKLMATKWKAAKSDLLLDKTKRASQEQSEEAARRLKATEAEKLELEAALDEFDEASQEDQRKNQAAAAVIVAKLEAAEKEKKELEEYLTEFEEASQEQDAAASSSAAQLQEQVRGLKQQLSAAQQATAKALADSQASSAQISSTLSAQLKAAETQKAELEEYIDEYETATAKQMDEVEPDKKAKDAEYAKEAEESQREFSTQLAERQKLVDDLSARLRNAQERALAAESEKKELEEYVDEFEKTSLEQSQQSKSAAENAQALEKQHEASLAATQAKVTQATSALSAAQAEVEELNAYIEEFEKSSLDDMQAARAKTAATARAAAAADAKAAAAVQAAAVAGAEKAASDQAAARLKAEMDQKLALATQQSAKNTALLGKHSSAVMDSQSKLAEMQAELDAMRRADQNSRDRIQRMIAKDTRAKLGGAVDRSKAREEARRLEEALSEAKKSMMFNKVFKYKIGGGTDGYGVWDHKPGKKNMGWEMKFTVDSTGRVFGSNKNDLDTGAGTKKKFYSGFVPPHVEPIAVLWSRILCCACT